MTFLTFIVEISYYSRVISTDNLESIESRYNPNRGNHESPDKSEQ